MKPQYKTVYRSFGYLRCDDFAAYLEEMAAKGWHLDSWATGLRFRKGEPEQVTYAVEVFSEASEYDTRPEPNTKEFAEYCEAAGWQLVDAKRKFVIFKKIAPDAAPILTDRERLEAVAAEEKKTVLRNLALSGTWVLMRWWDFWGMNFSHSIFTPLSILLLLSWGALFLAAAISGIRFLLWKARCIRNIEDGQMIYLGRGGQFTVFENRIYSGIAGLVVLLIFAVLLAEKEYTLLIGLAVFFAGIWLMGWFIARRRPDAVTNQIIQTVLSLVLAMSMLIFVFVLALLHEEPAPDPADIPLVIEDLGVDAGNLVDASQERFSSVFGSVSHTNLYYSDGSMIYFVYQSDADWILDKIWEEQTDAENWKPCDQNWGAEQSVTRFGSSYVVRYPDCILYFNGIGDEPLTDDQIAAVRDALIP